MPKTKLISYKGRKFVLLCNCNSNWIADLKKFNAGQDVGITGVPQCPTCYYAPWIILPKGEKV